MTDPLHCGHKEAAQILDVSDQTLTRYAKRGVVERSRPASGTPWRYNVAYLKQLAAEWAGPRLAHDHVSLVVAPDVAAIDQRNTFIDRDYATRALRVPDHAALAMTDTGVEARISIDALHAGPGVLHVVTLAESSGAPWRIEGCSHVFRGAGLIGGLPAGETIDNPRSRNWRLLQLVDQEIVRALIEFDADDAASGGEVANG